MKINSPSMTIKKKFQSKLNIEIKSSLMPESRQPRAGIPLDYPTCAIRNIAN